MNNKITSGINWQWFISLHVIAVLLLLSWLLEPTRSAWLEFDESFFWWINDWLRTASDDWKVFVAFVNSHYFDLIAAGLLLLLFAIELASRGRQQLDWMFALLSTLVVALICAAVIGQSLPIERPSATLLFNDSYRLREIGVDFAFRDLSRDTFPGDHGMVLFIITGFVLYYLEKWLGLVAIILSLILVTPRLIVGAHWLTDEIVGAVFVGLIVIAWFMATPISQKLIGWFEKRWQWFFKTVVRVDFS